MRSATDKIQAGQRREGTFLMVVVFNCLKVRDSYLAANAKTEDQIFICCKNHQKLDTAVIGRQLSFPESYFVLDFSK